MNNRVRLNNRKVDSCIIVQLYIHLGGKSIEGIYIQEHNDIPSQ